MALTGSLVVGPDRNGRTIAIVDGIVAVRAPDETPTLRCPDGEIVPGAACAHTHIYSGLVPYGMPQPAPPPENFLEILGKVWWRLDKAIDAGSLQAAARDYVARAARRHDDADRSSRIAQHDRRLAGNSWRSLSGARNSGGALLWRHRAKLWP